MEDEAPRELVEADAKGHRTFSRPARRRKIGTSLANLGILTNEESK